MTTKTKKESTKKTATAAATGGVTKPEKKGLKMAETAPEESIETEVPSLEDTEELEEQAEAAAAESSSQNGNAAALAAAAGNPIEMSASFKNFRHHPDMENFYRFIYENDLRHEALAIIDEIMVEKQERRLAKGPKTQAH